MFYYQTWFGNHTLQGYCTNGLQKTYKKNYLEKKGHYSLKYLYKSYKKRENWGWKGKKDFRVSWNSRVEKRDH